jgi:hypothetical protein
MLSLSTIKKGFVFVIQIYVSAAHDFIFLAPQDWPQPPLFDAWYVTLLVFECT